MNDQERRSATMPAVTASSEKREVVAVRVTSDATRQARMGFHFDHVLTSFSTQMDVFAVTLKPLIKEVLAGYECAVFAYGQTGTGKTFTMEGDLSSSEKRGLVPRAAEALIRSLTQEVYLEHSVTTSCLEIYNEELIDLLACSVQKLEVKQTLHGVCCAGLSEIPVASVEEIQEQIRRAQEKRRVSETRINARSSRSHCLFTLKVTCVKKLPDGDLENSCGKLHLVDLAGSECARKAEDRSLTSGSASLEANSKGERERRNINQSLLTLGRVIASLRAESSRIPYRDSKLTRMLQEALGGGCRTVMIATISPAQSSIDETISTLQYAEQASGIHNRPVAACCFKSARSPVGLGSDTPRLGFGDLSTCPTSVESGMRAEAQELEMRLEYLTQEVEEAHAAFDKKQQEVQELHAQVEAAERKRASAVCQLEEAKQAVAERMYMFTRTAEFADGRTEDVKRLSVALELARKHSVDLTRRNQEHCATAAAVRKQVRNVIAAGEDHASSFLEGIKKCVADITSGSKEALCSHRKGMDIMTEVTAKQRADIEAFEQEVLGHAEEIQKHMASVVQKLTDHVADRKITNSRTSSDLLCSMREVLNDSMAQSNAHMAELSDILKQAAIEQTASTDRHGSMREALHDASSSFSAKMSTHAAPLQDILRSLEEGLVEHCDHLHKSLQTVLDQLGNVKGELTKAVSSSEVSLKDLVANADTMLTSIGQETQGELVHLQELVAAGLAKIKEESLAEVIDQHLQDLNTSLAQQIRSELAAIAEAHVSVEGHTRSIRDQLSAEQEAVAQLSKQREAMSSSLTQIQSALSSLFEGVQKADEMLSASEEAQKRHRSESLDRILVGVRQLVMTEFEGLGRELDKGSSTVRHELAQISDTSLAIEKAAVEIGDSGHEASMQVSQIVSDWASHTGKSCDLLKAEGDNVAAAVGNLQTAASEAARCLNDVQGQVKSWGDACGSVVQSLDQAAASASGLQALQESLESKWKQSQHAVESERGVLISLLGAAGSSVESTLMQHGSISKNLEVLQSDSKVQAAAASHAVDAIAEDEAVHASTLAEVAELQSHHAVEDSKVQSARCERMGSLVQSATALVSTMALQFELLEGSWQCVSQATEALSASAHEINTDSENQQAMVASVQESTREVNAGHQRIEVAVKSQDECCDCVTELPSLWRDCIAVEPMCAFQDDDLIRDANFIFEDEDTRIPEVSVSIQTRPSEQELLAEFQRCRLGTNNSIDIENSQSNSCESAQVKTIATGKKSVQTARTALKEVQLTGSVSR